ncbi:hypothetical protein AQUCO_00400649v1 [Aquilegia coerulea]|uniref:Rieske domain-containing protein n=1 Tax=Aquilegia coerulea TaxID=218851 RepID=A0A2G5EW17_AQUCA|nr:hypothetical protein AQUCO_00400649v1 [Aquilegia coerulea]
MVSMAVVSVLQLPTGLHDRVFIFVTTVCLLALRYRTRSKHKFNSSSFSKVSTEPEGLTIPYVDNEGETDKFDWHSHWYPVMALCDLDKKVPNAKKILGIDVVVWWDRNEKKWQVFEDKCPHRLAPLSEGRIDQWGRLQCVYHGWCFNGSGDCKVIPQAPPDGPPVNASKKACVAVYPTIEQNQILWFWPNSAYQYNDIAANEKPPYIPELDDPSYYPPTISTRDIPYGYEVLIENLMDPSHVPYAHYGIMTWPSDESSLADREGGRPMEITVQTLDTNGFFAKEEAGYSKFSLPCLFYFVREFGPSNGSAPSGSIKEEPLENLRQRRMLLIFMCVPVSPGNSRLISLFPVNYGPIVPPRWVAHLGQNLVIDSDLYLLHMQGNTHT